MGGAWFVKLLLDTHVWIWSLLDPDRLRGKVRRELGDSKNEIWLSSISVWETLVLARKGRLSLEGNASDWVEEALGKAPLLEAPITHEIALESHRVELPHPDPADRFLVATARVLELTLVTADDRLLRSRACPVLANR